MREHDKNPDDWFDDVLLVKTHKSTFMPKSKLKEHMRNAKKKVEAVKKITNTGNKNEK